MAQDILTIEAPPMSDEITLPVRAQQTAIELGNPTITIEEPGQPPRCFVAVQPISPKE